MELLAGEAVASLAVAQRVAEDDLVGFLVLDEHVRAADRPAFVVVLLPVEAEIGLGVAGADRFLGNRQHAAGAAGGVVNLPVDARLVDVLLAGIDEVSHQPDHLARREVVAGLLVRLLVEAHDEVLEEIAHLDVVDPIRVQVDAGHRLDDDVKAVARIELLDLVAELELLENAPSRVGETVDVGDEIGRDVLAVAQQFLERVGADVVEGLLAVLIDDFG